MKKNTTTTIFDYIASKHRAVSANELAIALGTSRVTIHTNLKKMVSQGILTKKGQSPKVFYELLEQEKILPNTTSTSIDPKIQMLIEENFLIITPTGSEVSGIRGFAQWCTERRYPMPDKAIEYAKQFSEYESFTKNGYIDATTKIQSSFSHPALDHLYYLHPHSIPVFGKTKIAQLLFHAKQTQDKKLIERVLDLIVPEIQDFIKKNTFDSIAFVPPTVTRTTQFMKRLEARVASTLPTIPVEKIRTTIIIQQKSLKDIGERTANAVATMLVQTHDTEYTHTLILDDFTGSGATLNAIAEKMKKQGVSKNISGLTITGSMKGFEVVKEI
jgi:predicted amidophosphoribosyltransferase/biotin operon repressor